MKTQRSCTRSLKTWGIKDIATWTKNLPKLSKPKDFLDSDCPLIKRLDEEAISNFLIGKTTKMFVKYFPSIKFSGGQVQTIVEVLIEDYGGLRVNEVDYFFKLVAKGEFGSVFQNLDPATVLDKLRQYFKYREQIFLDQQDAQHKRNKGTRTHNKGTESKMSNSEAFKTFKLMHKK